MKRLFIIVLSCILAAGLTCGLTACSIDINKDNGESVHFDLGDLSDLENFDWDEAMAASSELIADNPEFAEAIEGILSESMGGESSGEQGVTDGYLNQGGDDADQAESLEDIAEQIGGNAGEITVSVEDMLAQLQDLMGESSGGGAHQIDPEASGIAGDDVPEAADTDE